MAQLRGGRSSGWQNTAIQHSLEHPAHGVPAPRLAVAVRMIRSGTAQRTILGILGCARISGWLRGRGDGGPFQNGLLGQSCGWQGAGAHDTGPREPTRARAKDTQCSRRCRCMPSKRNRIAIAYFLPHDIHFLILLCKCKIPAQEGNWILRRGFWGGRRQLACAGACGTPSTGRAGLTERCQCPSEG